MERGPPLPDASLLAHATINHVNEYAHELSNESVNIKDTLHHYLYGLYKQAIEGDCHDDPPPLFAVLERDQFDAWMNNHGMDPTVAAANYISAAKVVLAGEKFDPYVSPTPWLPYSTHTTDSPLPPSPLPSLPSPATASTPDNKGGNSSLVPSPVRFSPSTSTFPQTSPPSYRNHTTERPSVRLTASSSSSNDNPTSSSDEDSAYTSRTKPLIPSTNDISVVSTNESVTETDMTINTVTIPSVPGTTIDSEDTPIDTIDKTANNNENSILTMDNDNDTTVATNDEEDDSTLSHGFPIAGLFLTPTSVFAGWMLKKREKISIFTSQRWRRRWVVLTGRQLRYYASPSDAAHEARDIIYLANGVTIDCDPVPTGASLSSMNNLTTSSSSAVSSNKNDKNSSNTSSKTSVGTNSNTIDPQIGLETGENRPIGRLRSVASAVARSVAITNKKPSLASAVLAAAAASNRKGSISSDSDGGDDDTDNETNNGSRPRASTTVGNTTIITSTKPPDKAAAPPVTFRIRHQESKKEYCFAIWGLSALEDRERWVVVLRAATSGFLVDPATKTDDNVILRNGLKVKNTKAVILQSPKTTKPNPLNGNGKDKKGEDLSTASVKPKTPALLAAVQALKQKENKSENNNSNTDEATPNTNGIITAPIPTPAPAVPEKSTPKVGGLLALAKAMKKQQQEEEETAKRAKEEEEKQATKLATIETTTVVMESNTEQSKDAVTLPPSVQEVAVVMEAGTEPPTPPSVTSVPSPSILPELSPLTNVSSPSPKDKLSSPKLTPSLIPSLPPPVLDSTASLSSPLPLEPSGPPPYVSPTLPPEPQLSIVRRLLAQCNDAAVSTKGWKKTGVKNDITCYVSEDGAPACRGEGFIPYPRAAIFELISKLETRKMTDTQFDWGENVHDWNVHTKLTHLVFHGFRPVVAQRDLLLLVYWKIEPDGTVIMVSTSYEDEKRCPLIDGVVRAHLHIGGWILRPRPGLNGLSETTKRTSTVPLYAHPDIEREGCDVTYFMRTDLKGDIPSWLVSRITAQQAGIVGVVRDKLNEFYGKNGTRGGNNGLKDIVPMVNVYEESPVAENGGTSGIVTEDQSKDSSSINSSDKKEAAVTNDTKTDVTPPTSAKAPSSGSTTKKDTSSSSSSLSVRSDPSTPITSTEATNTTASSSKGFQFTMPDISLPTSGGMLSSSNNNSTTNNTSAIGSTEKSSSKGKKSLASLIGSVNTSKMTNVPSVPLPSPSTSINATIIPSVTPSTVVSSSSIHPSSPSLSPENNTASSNSTSAVSHEPLSILDKCFGTTNPILSVNPTSATNDDSDATVPASHQAVITTTVDRTRKLIYSFINPNDKSWKHYMPSYVDYPDQRSTAFVLLKYLFSGNITKLLTYIPNSDVLWSRERILGSYRTTNDTVSTRFDTIVDIAPSTLCSLLKDNGLMELVETDTRNDKDTIVRYSTIKEYNACNRLLKCTWMIPQSKGYQTFTSNIIQHIRILEDWEVNFNIPAILLTETYIQSNDHSHPESTTNNNSSDVPSTVGLTRVWLIRPLVHSSYQFSSDSSSLLLRSAVTHLTFYNTVTTKESPYKSLLTSFDISQRYQFMERFRNNLYYGLQAPSRQLLLPLYNSLGHYITKRKKPTEMLSKNTSSLSAEQRLAQELQIYAHCLQLPVDQCVKAFGSIQGMYTLVNLPLLTYREQSRTFHYPMVRTTPTSNKGTVRSILKFIVIFIIIQILTLVLSGLLMMTLSPWLEYENGSIIGTIASFVMLGLILDPDLPSFQRNMQLWILLPIYTAFDTSTILPIDTKRLPHTVSTASITYLFETIRQYFPNLTIHQMYGTGVGIIAVLVVISESILYLTRSDPSLLLPKEYRYVDNGTDKDDTDNTTKKRMSKEFATVIENYKRKQHLTTLTINRSSPLLFDGTNLLLYNFTVTERYGTVLPLSLPILMGKVLSILIKTTIPSQYLENNNTDVMIVYRKDTKDTKNKHYTYSTVTNMGQQTMLSSLYAFSRSGENILNQIPNIVIVCTSNADNDGKGSTTDTGTDTENFSKDVQAVLSYAPLVVYLSGIQTVRSPSLSDNRQVVPYADYRMEMNLRSYMDRNPLLLITELKKILNNYTLCEQTIDTVMND